MKGLKKIALVAAIAAASTAHADMVSLDDTVLGNTTGQAGLTIDIHSAEVKMGAVDYKDGGFISIKDVKLTGGTGAFGGTGDGILNDIQIMVDVVGDGSDLGRNNMGETLIDLASVVVSGGGAVSGHYDAPVLSDGDLLISVSATDFTNLLNQVDYSLDIGSVGLGKSTEEIGNISTGTVLISDFKISGYFGPTEIFIDSDGGGMNISTYFNAEGSLKVPFMGVETKIAIHNSRGADKVWLAVDDKGHSMAHAQLNVNKGTSAKGINGLAIELQNFEADIDFEDITIGGSAIGSVYLTDLRMTGTALVYGH
ncbi:DUF6160 family protein [Alkalimarinus alittae]|uniref:DUF6160 family protein n=1 Tax=Alkalimarinus alittae TaxID=2961619 RepID=A0ABY6MZW9_9ALTE|nr:DUF6160 family protein [Alkalimarinus alittae]UZE95340.1 DUF6160 family protein [Alkalimarinus alittae]